MQRAQRGGDVRVELARRPAVRDAARRHDVISDVLRLDRRKPSTLHPSSWGEGARFRRRWQEDRLDLRE
eukprot:9892845-Alexandrium_andersonii.AAC.1